MICKPGRATAETDVFAFSGGADAAGRLWETGATLLSAGWRAYWALAFEALNPENYRH